MSEIVVYCHATQDGRRSTGISVERRDYFEWDSGSAPPQDEWDPRLEWTVELRTQSDRPLVDEAEVAYWYRCHRASLAEVVKEAADQVPLGIPGGVWGWRSGFPRPWGQVTVDVSACNSFHSRKVAEYLNEFAESGLGAVGVRPLAIKDAVAPTEWLTLKAEV